MVKYVHIAKKLTLHRERDYGILKTNERQADAKEGRSCKSWVTGASSRKREPLKDDHFWDYSTTVLGGGIAELSDIMFIWRVGS